MEEDEEIILQNSPLDAYLQEVTDSDFSKYQSVNEQNIFEETTGKKSLFDTIQDVGLDTGIVLNAESTEVIHMCGELFNSNLLTSDDYSLLIELKDSVTRLTNSLGTEESKLVTRKKRFNIPYVLLSFGLFCLIAGIVVQQIVTLDRATWIFLLFLLLIICAAVGRVWWAVDSGFGGASKRTGEIKDFIQKMHGLDKLLDRSVTHVREVEVISAGFQMFRKPITKELLGRKAKKCLRLRSVVLDLLIDLFMELRVNERLLLQTYSDELFTVKEEFLATMPLAKFNELISNERPAGDDLQLPNISLDKLKAMVYLYRVLLSEFTLSLIVCCHSSVVGGRHLPTDLLHSVEQVAASLENHVGGLEHALEKSIKLTFRKEGDANGVSRNSTANSRSPVDELFRKCKLNLYSSLTRIEEAELLIHENPTAFDVVILENLSLQFGMSIDNAKACVEDVMDILKPKDCRPKEAGNVDEPREDEDATVIPDFVPAPELGDMLYEGESLEAALKTSMDMFSIEDLEQQLKESRESRRLLRELKSIFSVKDSPAGLLSFPLTKVSGTEDQRELTDDDEDLAVFRRKKRGMITGDQDFYGEGEEDPEARINFPTAPIGLPVNLLLQGLSKFASQTEEKFGSSDDESV